MRTTVEVRAISTRFFFFEKVPFFFSGHVSGFKAIDFGVRRLSVLVFR